MFSNKFSRLLFSANLCSKNNNQRLLQSINVHMSTQASVKTDRETFQNMLPRVIDSFTSHPKFNEVPNATQWIKRVMEYNLTGGKMNRGLSTVFSYEMLETPENISEHSLTLARLLGWSVEMVYFLMLDDIMDGSTTRRGMPCWYQVPGVGLGAINDATIIHSAIYQLLKANFREHPCYVDILDLINECLGLTSIGQYLDYQMAHQNRGDYSLFTIDNYFAIVKHKTSYYTYKLPVALGLYLARVTDPETHRRTEEICLDIGNFFQIQDDYLDCYGDESVTGKIGTDIQEGKCSWLAVTALQCCSPEQRIVFDTCYGSKEPAHVERIKWLYQQLEIPKKFSALEAETYDRISTKIRAMPQHMAPLFFKLIDAIYKRKS